MGVNLNFKKIIAIFIIFLIVSLTPVLALELDYSIYGQEEVDEMVAAGEEFTAEIINPGNQVYINVSGELSSCSCDDTFNECTCYFAPVFNPGEKIIHVAVGDVNAGLETGEMHYYLDAEPPQVTANSSLDGNELIVDYVITDSSGSTMFLCSGIKNFDVFINQQLAYTEVFNTKNCSVSGQAIFNIEPSPILDISFRATDLSGLSDEVDLEQLSMDAFAPIVAGTFEIYQGETPIDRLALNNPQIPLVDIVFFVTEEELAPNGVTGDLTDFNNLPTQNLGYQNMLALCIKEPGTTELYECRFKNIKFHPEDEIIELPLSLTDAQNNHVTPILQRQYPIVVAQNEVIHIGPELTKNCDANLKCYVSKNPIIRVVISGAEDSSFSQMNVPLKTRQLSTNDYVNPYKCEQEIDKWVCSYAVSVNPDFNNQIKSIYLDNAASDDYGKRLTGLNKRDMYIDMTPPEISEDKIMLVNNVEVQDYCLTGSDTLTVQVEATDARSPELFIYATTHATTDINHFDRCVKEGSKFVCTIDISSFIPAEEDDKKIDISIQDLAGNKETFTINIDLCMNNIEDIPDLIDPSIDIVSANPMTVDKSIASYRYWKAFISMNFDVNNNAKLIDYEVRSCEVYHEEAGIDYIYGVSSDSYYFFNKGPESGDAAVLIGGQSILTRDNEKVPLICEIDFYGRIGNTFYRRPQTANLTIMLDFDGINLDGPDKILDEEIAIYKKKVKDLEKDMKWRKTLDTTMKYICGYGKTVAKLNAVIQTLSIVYKVLCTLFSLTTDCNWFHISVAQPMLQFTEQAAWPGGNFYSNWLTIFTGGGYPVLGIAVKSACFIYECKFYDAQEAVDFAAKQWLPDSLKLEEIEVEDKDKNTVSSLGEERTKAKTEYGTIKEDYEGFEKAIEDHNLKEDFEFTLESEDKTVTWVAPKEGMSSEIYAQTYEDWKDTQFDYLQGKKQSAKETFGDAKSALRKLNKKQSIEGSSFTHESIITSTWVVDPFKSVHYDAVCLKAQFFNLQKEKELKCLHIKCLQDAKQGAFTKDVCNEVYDYRECLYLTGAQSKLAGGSNNYFWASFTKAATGALIGTAFSYAFQIACGQYYSILYPRPYIGNPVGQWLCGAGSILISWNELAYGWKGLFSGFKDTDLGNNCEGINLD